MATAKENYQAHLVTNYANDKGKLYRHLQAMVTPRSIPDIVHLGDAVESDPVKKCNFFNMFFNSIFSNSSDPPPNAPPASHHMSDMYPDLLAFSEADVYEILSTLDPTKSSGPDGIGPAILRNCALALASPLHHLFNISIRSACIPKQWKIHLIVPIFKSGDKSDISNYRPTVIREFFVVKNISLMQHMTKN